MLERGATIGWWLLLFDLFDIMAKTKDLSFVFESDPAIMSVSLKPIFGARYGTNCT